MKASFRQYAKAIGYTSYVRMIDATTPRIDTISPAAADAVASLRRDGFVRLGNLRPIGNLAGRIGELLDVGEVRYPGVSRFYLKHPLMVAPEIGDWLRIELLNEVVRGYLGGNPAFDRCLVWRIPASSNERRTSAIWHHDWCGHRLKLFILLHDVEAGGRPTQYVVGSHRGKWRWMNYELSRHADAEAEAQGEVALLTGKAGDCILFDTNGLHRATGEGGHEARDVISFEYSDRRKSGLLAHRGFEVGVRRDLIPEALLEGDTLIDRSLLRHGPEGVVYGDAPQLEREPFV